jgi:hypothetical protein
LFLSKIGTSGPPIVLFVALELRKERLMSKNPYAYKTIKGVKKTMHRHVMEESLGRELEPEEHVYHLNGDSRDNRLENLIIIKKKSWNPNVRNQYR